MDDLSVVEMIGNYLEIYEEFIFDVFFWLMSIIIQFN